MTQENINFKMLGVFCARVLFVNVFAKQFIEIKTNTYNSSIVRLFNT